MPRDFILPETAGRTTLCALVLLVAGCGVEAPETGAPERIEGLTTPRLLTGPEIAAATQVATAETPPVAARAATLRARAAALRADVLTPAESARLSGAAERP